MQEKFITWTATATQIHRDRHFEHRLTRDTLMFHYESFWDWTRSTGVEVAGRQNNLEKINVLTVNSLDSSLPQFQDRTFNTNTKTTNSMRGTLLRIDTLATLNVYRNCHTEHKLWPKVTDSSDAHSLRAFVPITKRCGNKCPITIEVFSGVFWHLGRISRATFIR